MLVELFNMFLNISVNPTVLYKSIGTASSVLLFLPYAEFVFEIKR